MYRKTKMQRLNEKKEHILYMIEDGLSQYEIARKMRVSQSYLCKWLKEQDNKNDTIPLSKGYQPKDAKPNNDPDKVWIDEKALKFFKTPQKCGCGKIQNRNAHELCVCEMPSNSHGAAALSNYRRIQVGDITYNPFFKKAQSDGSTADYYKLPEGATELQHLISHKDMNGQLAEIFRTAYRYGTASHSDKLRDANKIKFYIDAEIERLEKL